MYIDSSAFWEMSLCTRTRRAEYQWNWNNVLGMNLGKKIEINTTNSALFTQNLSFVSLILELDKKTTTTVNDYIKEYITI